MELPKVPTLPNGNRGKREAQTGEDVPHIDLAPSLPVSLPVRTCPATPPGVLSSPETSKSAPLPPSGPAGGKGLTSDKRLNYDNKTTRDYVKHIKL